MSQGSKPLEAFSGSWTIMAAFCVVFLTLHIRWAWARRPFSIFNIPDEVGIAVAFLIVCFAELITRGAIWYWRALMGGDPLRLIEFATPLAVGAVSGMLGFLCILRIVSRPYGQWPFIAACAVVLGYLATFLF